MELIANVFQQYPNDVILWCCFALLLGGAVKGVVGVGLPMIAVPLMSFVLPAYVAAALLVLPVFPANIVQARAGGSIWQKIKRFWPLTIGIAAGTFASAPLLIAANPKVLQFIVACLVGLYALQRIRKRDITIKPERERTAGLLMGLFCGGIGGITMLIGPLVAVYMAALKLERDVFVGSIALIYLVTTLSIGLALASVDQLTPNLIAASLLACIPATIGVVSGAYCRKFVSQAVFEQLLTVLILAISLSMFYRALS